MIEYLSDPTEIRRQTLAAIRREVDLARVPEDLRPVALALVRASAMPGVVEGLVASPGAASRGIEALRRGAPILTDAQMVARAIDAGVLPRGNQVLCYLNDPATSGLAHDHGTTRSAAAVELWREHLEGAVVAIGNAPTALFHLLDRLEQGWPMPAVILGFPVGFVGAAESKAALAAQARVPFIALRGRRGGSAMAAAAANALAAPEAWA